MQYLYVFLDFDGVTHPVSANNNYFRSDCIQYIYSAINIYNPKIVITSTWRLDVELKQMTSHLDNLDQYVVGSTPEINEPFTKHIRQLEVEKYLSVNNIKRVPWVAIDDNAVFYRDDAPVYITDGREGFTQDDIKPLREFIDTVLNNAGNK